MPAFGGERGAQPRFDSVVLNSTGVGALTMAGRLARTPAFQDRVRIAGTPVEESRRLIGGVTLRARSLDLFAAAMGVDRAHLVESLFGLDASRAETHQQFICACSGSPGAGFQLDKIGSFMDRRTPRRNRPRLGVLAYGVRNSHLRAVLQEFALRAGMKLRDMSQESGNPGNTSRAALVEYADGYHPLIVNATPSPLPDTPIIRPPAKPTRAVAAAQLTFRASRLEERAVVPRNSSMVCAVLRGGALDVGVFYPFQDPLTPEADYYGIFYRVEALDSVTARRGELLHLLEDTAVGVGDVFGLEPVDRDATLGTAVVPLSPWSRVTNCQQGVFDLSRVAGAGAPIITGDGMTRAGIAGWVAAESLIHGHDPLPAANKALRRYRQLNWELCLAMTHLARPTMWLMRMAPRLTFFRQIQSYDWDMWAGIN